MICIIIRRSPILLSLLLLASCAGTQWSPGEMIQGVVWDVTKRWRAPGENLLSDPNTVRKEYDCSNKKHPFVTIEKNEIIPPRLNPGGEFNHRFIYVMCPNKAAEVVKGNLYRRVYFQGSVLFEDVSRDFELKPGRWSVDAFITVPPDAKPGVYSVQMAFSGNQTKFEENQSLVIRQ